MDLRFGEGLSCASGFSGGLEAPWAGKIDARAGIFPLVLGTTAAHGEDHVFGTSVVPPIVRLRMKIVASEYHRKSSFFQPVSRVDDSVTTFGDHQMTFDLEAGRVVRLKDSDSEVVAQIQPGWKGARLAEFLGTVESDSFIVTKRNHDRFSWLSGNVIFEVTLKHCAISVASMVMRGDLFNSFRVGDVLKLKLSHDGVKLMVEGTCADDHRDLAEVLACLLLYHNEPARPYS